jgi:hypothetical protein
LKLPCAGASRARERTSISRDDAVYATLTVSKRGESLVRIRTQSEAQSSVFALWACSVWILSGLYLFATTPDASFISLAALAYFAVGPFVASIIFRTAAAKVVYALSFAHGAFFAGLSTGMVSALNAAIVFLGGAALLFTVAKLCISLGGAR